MNEKLYALTVAVITIAFAIYQFFQKRIKVAKENEERELKIAKEKGIEEVAKEMAILKYEKIKEQFRVVKERSDIMFSLFLNTFADKMKLDFDDTRVKLYNDCILNYIRKETDEKMAEVIYVNNIAGRKDLAWREYKNVKFKVIFDDIQKKILDIWREDILGFPRQTVINKCYEEIHRIYSSHIDDLFEEVRNVAITYQSDIDKYQSLLENMRLKILQPK